MFAWRRYLGNTDGLQKFWPVIWSHWNIDCWTHLHTLRSNFSKNVARCVFLLAFLMSKCIRNVENPYNPSILRCVSKGKSASARFCRNSRKSIWNRSAGCEKIRVFCKVTFDFSYFIFIFFGFFSIFAPFSPFFRSCFQSILWIWNVSHISGCWLCAYRSHSHINRSSNQQCVRYWMGSSNIYRLNRCAVHNYRRNSTIEISGPIFSNSQFMFSCNFWNYFILYGHWTNADSGATVILQLVSTSTIF